MRLLKFSFAFLIGLAGPQMATAGEKHESSIAERGYLTDDNDKPLRDISQYWAKELCESKGMRLPTIRELARWATKRGAVILETSDFDNDKIPVGYTKDQFEKICTYEQTNKADCFHYSHKGYVSPSGAEVATLNLWSLSVNPHKEVVGFQLSSGEGFILPIHRNYPDSALCVGASGTIY